MRLRPFQTEALAALREAPHVLCVAPTGAGKTRIIEELLRQGERVLLFSPLAALARQQQSALDPRRAAVVNPETRQLPRLLRELRPTLVAVDECHCYCEWGARFRPAFHRIPSVIRALPQPRSLWLTATLPRAMEREIRRQLPGEARALGRFRLGESLHLRALRCPWPERPARLRALLRVYGGSGMIFTRTRNGAESVARLVQATGAAGDRAVRAYHAGLAREERLAIEARAASDANQIIVATSAFGLGLHLPRFRWVILWEAPHSPLALAQLAGRAGRTAEPAFATLLWDEEDFRAPLDPAGVEPLRDLLLHPEPVCREEALAALFAERPLNPGNHCNRCDICSLD